MRELTPEDPRELAGFRILAGLGEGGMGQVYLAVGADGVNVALKTIRPELARDSEFRARFAREVDAARRISGAGVAAVVGADPQCERPWLATQYIPGITLSEAVYRHGPIPVAQLRSLGAQLAATLASIHATGLTHRDIKPSNIMLAPDGPVVIDFGVARATDASYLTRTGQLVGSPGFMSP